MLKLRQKLLNRNWMHYEHEAGLQEEETVSKKW